MMHFSVSAEVGWTYRDIWSFSSGSLQSCALQRPAAAGAFALRALKTLQ